MKVAELRAKLSTLKKEEIIKLSVEFYKLIPKAKKEDYDIDAFINNPSEKKTKGSVKSLVSLAEVEPEIKLFIENAKAQNYLYPNREVSKRDRATWRFKVKKWYKELSNTKRGDADIGKQAKLLSDLYSLLCEACGYQYFSGYDPFQSVGVDQVVFYSTVINLLQEDKGKGDSLEACIKLIIENHLNRYTLNSGLMQELLITLNIPDLKEKGIEIVNKLMIQNGFNPKPIEKSKVWRYSTSDYRKEERNNNLVELGYRFYCGLFEVNKGIDFYQEHHYNRSEEVKLYILVRLLFEEGRKEKIREVLEDSIEKGIKPRDGLMKLLKEIKEKDTLPNYL